MSILLTSTVIVALISFYKWKQSQALERITDSRAEWREGLRKIAIDILEADDYDERILLSELKVRINTKGLMLRLNNLNSEQDKNDYFMQDGYIWELIKKIEISNGKSQKDMLKQKLVEAISLLIKYDWDRSKHEITSNQVTKFNPYDNLPYWSVDRDISNRLLIFCWWRYKVSGPFKAFALLSDDNDGFAAY